MSPGREPLLTPVFALCFAGSFLQAVAFNLFVHFPGFLQELGADAVWIGLVTGATGIAAIVSRPLVGRLMDASGRRLVILLGGALNVATLSLYATVDSIGPWVFGVRMLHGLAEAMLFSGFFTYAVDIVPVSRRTEGIALFGISGILPMGLGGLLGDWLLGEGGFGWLFVAAVAFAGVSFTLSLALRDHRPATRADEPARGFRATIAQADLRPLWFVGSVFATSLTGAVVFVKAYVGDVGQGSVGPFFGAYSAAAVLLRLGFGWLPDRLGPKNVLYPSLVLLAAGLAAVPLVGGSTGFLLAGALCGLGHGFTFPILSGMVVSRTRDADRGTAVSIFTALFDAGIVVGGPLLGAVVVTAGYPAMFLVAAAMVLAGDAVYALWDRDQAPA